MGIEDALAASSIPMYENALTMLEMIWVGM